MRAFFLLFLLFPLASGASAQAIIGPDGEAKDRVSDLVTEIVIPTVRLLPPIERERIRSTQIRIVRGGPFPGPLAGKDRGQRIILLPEIFVMQLYDYTTAQILASVYNQPHFAEWWLDYTLWRSPVFGSVSDGPFYRGHAPQRPLEYAGFGHDRAQSFRAKYNDHIEGAFVAALLDVLLHELGHHAKEAWYDENTPGRVARQIEESVDAWASRTFNVFVQAYPNVGFIDVHNVLGRLFAISYLFSLDRWRAGARVEPGMTHPEHTVRIASLAATSDCSGIVEGIMSDVCEGLHEQIGRITTQARAEENYRTRADRGEAFAQYRLALLAFRRGNYSEACESSLRSAGSTDRRHFHYVGWCYENGYFADGLPVGTAQMMAERSYAIAAEVGWADSQAALRRVQSP